MTETFSFLWLIRVTMLSSLAFDPLDRREIGEIFNYSTWSKQLPLPRSGRTDARSCGCFGLKENDPSTIILSFCPRMF